MIYSREKIDVLRGGRVIDSTVLSRNCPRAAFFVELRETASALATGKTKKQAEIEAHRRAAWTFFDAATKRINKIAQVDLSTAEDLTNELLHFLTPEKNEKEKSCRKVSGNPHDEEILALRNFLETADAVLTVFGDRLDKISPDSGPNFMAAVEAPLDALALDDPEAATRVYEACDYFQEEIRPGEVYFGQGVIADRALLETYDTREKREAFIARMHE